MKSKNWSVIGLVFLFMIVLCFKTLINDRCTVVEFSSLPKEVRDTVTKAFMRKELTKPQNSDYEIPDLIDFDGRYELRSAGGPVWYFAKVLTDTQSQIKYYFRRTTATPFIIYKGYLYCPTYFMNRHVTHEVIVKTKFNKVKLDSRNNMLSAPLNMIGDGLNKLSTMLDSDNSFEKIE